MPSTHRSGLDTALAALARRRWLALAVFGIVAAAALSFARSLPNLYQSTATLLVAHPTAPRSDDELNVRLQTIRHELLSRTRLLALIDHYGLYRNLRKVAPEELVVERFRHDVEIDASNWASRTGQGWTIALALRYRGLDRDQVAAAANRLADSYLTEDQSARERQAGTAAAALADQVEEVAARLTREEDRIAAFRKAHVGELPEHAEANRAKLERIADERRLLAGARSRAMERRAALLADPEGAASRKERLERELEALRARFTDRHPEVGRKLAEIEALEGEGAAAAPELSADRKLQLAQVDDEIRSLDEQDARLDREAGALERQVETAPWREEEFQKLTRGHATTREVYQSLLKEHQEAVLAQGQEGQPTGQRLRLLDPAVPAALPVAPNRPSLAILGLIVATLLALAAVAIAERLDTSFHTADELRAFTRLPVLASVPALQTSPVPAPRIRPAAVMLALAFVGMLAVTVEVSHLAARNNDGIVALLARGRS